MHLFLGLLREMFVIYLGCILNFLSKKGKIKEMFLCEEKERKDKTVKEEVSIAGEAEAGGDPSEAIKHILDVKECPQQVS